MYEQAGFVKTGSNPKSVFVNGVYIAGHYYYKELEKLSNSKLINDDGISDKLLKLDQMLTDID